MAIPSQEQVTLLTDYDTNSTYNEAYQTLYANICFNWKNKQSKQHSVLLATPTSFVGQAAAVANIAIVAAQNGTPTVIVDADMQQPSLQQRFGVGESTGFSDLLNQEVITAESISAQLRPTFVPKLRLLCAGKANKAHTLHLLPQTRLEELVNSSRQLLAETESEPSLLIFHCAAVLASTHAAQLSALVEQTFLTIVTGRTTRVQAKKAQEQLQRAHATLMGAILLDV